MFKNKDRISDELFLSSFLKALLNIIVDFLTLLIGAEGTRLLRD
jgi:hypothetical protein